MLSELFHINLRFCSFFLYTSKIQIILCKIFHIKSHNFYINKFFSYCTFLKLTNYYAKEVTLLSHISQIRVLYISIFFFNFFAIIFSTWKIDNIKNNIQIMKNIFGHEENLEIGEMILLQNWNNWNNEE